MSGDICCNVEVSHEQERYLCTKHVTMRPMCGASGVVMTPDEARALARLLMRHAAKADGKEPTP